MNLYVGTSGYSYKEWKGTFYPEDLSQKEMLRFYSEQFATVEINNTFYRMPKPPILENWAAEVPPNFKFALKASQRITHFQRFKDAGDSLAYLLKVAATLRDRLGPLLFQTPPNFECNVERLRGFLELLPPPTLAAFEFRHQSWFTEQVFELLREHQAALCIAETDNDLQVPQVATAGWGYLRLRKLDYGTKELTQWASWIRRQAWRDAFVFFKHEDSGKAPQFARDFLHIADTARPQQAA